MSGSMWQGMETRQGDGTEALSQETESNGSATPKSRRHPLTLPTPVPPDRFRRGSAGAFRHISCYDELGVSPVPAAGEPNRWAATRARLASAVRNVDRASPMQ
jgi:hypothetical protein